MTGSDPEPKDYFVFGGCLRSQLKFPDLSPAISRDRPDWELRVGLSDPPIPIGLQGMCEVAPDWIFRLYRLRDGFRLEHDGIGSYDILCGGREIIWYPTPEPPWGREILLESARAILLGPVMAVALHQAGTLCLHGSAVVIGEEAVAFLAPKFYGKSTLALALTAAGARLLTDDLVAVDLRAAPVVLPGVHSVRVMEDIADRLGHRFPGATLLGGFKRTLMNIPRSQLAWEPTPLGAVYVLEPVAERDVDSPVSRDLLPLIQSAVALAHRKKLADGLVGNRDAGSMLQSIVSVVSAVPVYRLQILRDLERLPAVVREVMAWHGPAALARSSLA